MARAGHSVANPVTGQRLVFRTTARDTAGAYIELEWSIGPYGGKFPPEHVHPGQAEQFEIISGHARYRLDGTEHSASTGDIIDFPPNHPHLHPWNASEEVLQMRQITRSLRPDLAALETIEAVIETGFGLARDGKVKSDGSANPFQTAVLAREVRHFVHPTWPPLPIQSLAIAVLAPIGHLLGYRVAYDRYRGVSG